MSEMLYFEDFPAGHVTELGSWTPTADEIVAFAREWDPQPFHLDEEAGREGPFGGLVASGWHGICVWGRLYVDAVHSRKPTRSDRRSSSVSCDRQVLRAAVLVKPE